MTAPAKTASAITDWIETVNAHGPAGVGQAFGLAFTDRPAPGSLSPCPACAAAKRHPKRHDRRGAVGLTRDGGGWRCHECDAHGDALDLAALLATGKIPRKGDRAWRDVRAACAAARLCHPDPREEPRRAVALRPVPAPRPPAPPVRPPTEEVAEAWRSCGPVSADPDVAAWVRGRGLSAELVDERELARALPAAGPLPSWMRFEGESWHERTFRVVVPMYGPEGRLESLHARALAPREANGRDKAASPARAAVAGLVMADAGALAMLRRTFVPRVLVVAEGVPDFLTWSTIWSDASDDAPAVLGIIAGSWTDELGGAVPAGVRVAVRTHRDDAGEKYSAAICASLAARCRVHRFPRATP